jgi:2-phospho-L-lactate guanylyltransferase
MRSCALIPFKNFAQSKQRLRSVLNEAQRHVLVAAMLEDTLRAVGASDALQDFYLLSDDADARGIARSSGWQTIAESAQAKGLNASVQAAVMDLREAYDAVLIIHGDLPLLATPEVNAIVERHHEQFAANSQVMTLVPDQALQGSNCLMISPPDALSFQYGQLSFEKHLAMAAERGIQSTTLRLPGAALDVDEAADLVLLRQSAQLRAESATAQALAEIGDEERCE